MSWYLIALIPLAAFVGLGLLIWGIVEVMDRFGFLGSNEE